MMRVMRVTECNVPAQILATSEGRVMVSVMAIGPDEVQVLIRGRRVR